MLGLPESMEGAAGYLMEDVKYEYACANEKTYLDNYDCMNRTEIEHADDLLKCIERLHPEKDTCLRFKGILGCFEKMYTDSCGEGIFGFVCNFIERPSLAVLPECKGKLHDCGAPSAAGYAILIPTVLLTLFPVSLRQYHQ